MERIIQYLFDRFVLPSLVSRLDELEYRAHMLQQCVEEAENSLEDLATRHPFRF